MLDSAIQMVAMLLLLFGIINMSTAVYAYNWVCYAARVGTRYAAVHGSTSSSPVSSSNYSALTSTITGIATGLTGTVTVTPTWSPNNTPGSTVKVQVQYLFTFVMPIISPSPITMSSTSQMVIDCSRWSDRLKRAGYAYGLRPAPRLSPACPSPPLKSTIKSIWLLRTSAAQACHPLLTTL